MRKDRRSSRQGAISFRELKRMNNKPKTKKRMNARSLYNIGMHLRNNCNMSEDKIDKWMNERFILDNSVTDA